MSFAFDPPLLVASGVLIERRLPEDRRDVAEAATLLCLLRRIVRALP